MYTLDGCKTMNMNLRERWFQKLLHCTNLKDLDILNLQN
ncbi:protein of unknown function [Maridesulfovibrio hydrothermalis AM13 = DSM 14728]|uniref:Uncharacterized protein n=1 Tax=Maridesulfovibrio hydrothermalis AM13 = DSM 14728 TaxID=1121451 RepID=L0R6F1_9BACT|nr:protein of unknown function [Maridesulfovibrio hydrothermalis AM13 = DSM 14728]